MSADFIDSNVFVYLFDEQDAKKRKIAERLITEGVQTGQAIVSFQVVQETLNVLTRKLKAPPAEARRFLDEVLTPLWRVMPSAALYQRAIELQARYRYGFFDSMIVSAALDAGCRRLLSEDLQHGQRIESLAIVNPFQ